MVELYFDIMDITPENISTIERDYFVLSKGHAAPALYDILYRRDFITKEAFETYGREGTKLAEHPKRDVLGIDTATGSLGHGLSIAAGIAYSLKYSSMKGNVYCLLSDGECQEGSTIEAMSFAGRMKLDNLIAIVDSNRLQGYERTESIQGIDSVKNKFISSLWSAREMNGHDFLDMRSNFQNIPIEEGRPSLLIAHTVKGKGVREMEDRLEWHYKSPSDIEVDNFIKQLGDNK
jgi:transketolase